jgi:hypothetical protein
MPTKVITKVVCTTCGKSSCDGAIWEWVELVDDVTGAVDMIRIPAENRNGRCTSYFGQKHKKALTGKAVGDMVTLRFQNWSPPGRLTVRKVQA